MSGPAVQCADGRWYEGLIYEGDGWFVCFDDKSDPPELVVKTSLGRAPEDILRGRGIPFEKLAGARSGSRMFGAEAERRFKFTNARARFLRLPATFSWPVPDPACDRWDAVYAERPSWGTIVVGRESS